MEQIRCPADVAGCGASLTDADLSDVVSQSELEMASARVREVEEQNQRLIEDSTLFEIYHIVIDIVILYIYILYIVYLIYRLDVHIYIYIIY